MKYLMSVMIVVAVILFAYSIRPPVITQGPKPNGNNCVPCMALIQNRNMEPPYRVGSVLR